MGNIKFLNTKVALPQTPVKVYHTAAPAISNNSILGIAKTFSLQANAKIGTFASNNANLTYNEGNLVVKQCLVSGAVTYRDAHLWMMDDGKSHVAFNDDKASSMASAHLQSLNMVNMHEVQVQRVTNLNVGVCAKDGKNSETRVIDKGIVYTRLIDGIPVQGPGGKIQVYINAAEQETGHDHIWRALGTIHSTVDTKHLLTPDAAMADLKKFWANSKWDIEVASISFAYYEAGWGETQAFHQPAYIMPLTLKSADGRFKMGSVHVFSAIPNSPEALMPAPPAYAKQNPR